MGDLVRRMEEVESPYWLVQYQTKEESQRRNDDGCGGGLGCACSLFFFLRMTASFHQLRRIIFFKHCQRFDLSARFDWKQNRVQRRSDDLQYVDIVFKMSVIQNCINFMTDLLIPALDAELSVSMQSDLDP